MDSISKIIKKLGTSLVLKDMSNLAYAKIIASGVGLVSTIAMTKILGFKNFGIYQLILAYSSILSNMYVSGNNFYVYKAYCSGVHDYLKVAISDSILVGIILSLAIGVAHKLFPDTLGHSNSIVALGVIISFLPITSYFEQILQAKKKFRLLRNIKGMQSILVSSTTVVTAYLSNNIEYVLLSYFVTNLGFNSICWFLTLKHHSPEETGHPDIPILRKASWKHSKFNVIMGLSSKLDRVILGSISPELLTTYHLAQSSPTRIKELFKSTQLSPITHWSSLSGTLYLKNTIKYRPYIISAGCLVLFLATVITFIMELSFYSDRSFEVSLTFSAFLITIPAVFSYWNHVVLNHNMHCSDGNFFRKANLACKIVSLPACLILIINFQYWGALAYASVSPITLLVFSSYYLRKQDPFPHSRTIENNL